MAGDPSRFDEPGGTVPVQLGTALRREKPRWALVADAGVEHLVEETCTLGSSPHVEVRVPDPTVSRLHARLEPAPEGLWAHDLESTNGTFAGEEAIRTLAALLRDGTRVRFGNASFTCRAAESTTVPLYAADHLGPLRGRSPAMRELFELLTRIASSDSTVLVQGETGTGKDLVARAIHESSPRARGPFVVFDCAAIPEPLFESELCGHVRGAFTGADRSKEGAVQAAEGGTLFLDEVGELPLSVQPKLLRILESRTVRRVGEAQHRPVDVRIVAATHRDLARMVSQNAFREDLYFRLAVLPVLVPPLRARKEDVRLLVEHFLGGVSPEPSLIAAAMSRDWPGNVRELRTFVERAVTLGTSHAMKLGSGVARGPAELPEVQLDVPFKDLRAAWNDHLERAYVSGWLERSGGDVRAAAEAMGVDRTYVYRLLKKHGLGG